MNAANARPRVGVVGVGAMGSRVARRLAGAGYAVSVWNRTRSKAQGLVDAGAYVADTPGEIAASVDVLITMLADPEALRAVLEGPDGIAENIARGTIVAEMSTVGRDAIEDTATRLADKADVVDAPVLGSLSEAEQGRLVIFAAGAREVVARLDPIFSVLGRPLYVGARGSGAAAKLVANLTLLGVLGVLGEALALARALALPTETTFDVLTTTPLAAQAERRKPAVVNDDYELRFRLALARKDADLIQEAAIGRGLTLPVAAAAGVWFAEAVEAGLGDADYSAILGYIRSRAANP